MNSIVSHVRVISSEVIHANPWWNYKHDVYEYPDGHQGEHYYGEKPETAVIVPVLSDGRLVLIRQYRYLRGGWNIEFPSGHARPHEGTADTARRELEEETGCRANELIKVGQFSIPSFRGLVHVFLATGVEQVSAPHPDETEQVELVYRRLDELEGMVKNGEVGGAITLAAWALVRDHI